MFQQQKKHGKSLPDKASYKYLGKPSFIPSPKTTNHPTMNPTGRKIINKIHPTLPQEPPSRHILYRIAI